MRNAVKILAATAIIISLTGIVEASDSIFVDQKFLMPSRLRRPFLPPPGTPKKEYFPRQPFRPKPHYQPHTPKPTYDNRGGKRKNFGPPQAVHR